MPPSQLEMGGGSSWSGRSATSTPHDPLCTIRFWESEMYSVPARTMPDPTGDDPASPLPAPGTFGLLLSWMKLCSNTVQLDVPVGHVPSGPVWSLGHSPI